ncbi:MAG: serine/threonine-protein kinase [Acidobacteriota bacterium]|nr:serine/threonine-protein kinase [Acidobacteriota bacterium]
MSLEVGSRLGPYEIVAPIGAGGMGEVYRARDTRLERQVAVKILPESFADNAQFKIRFQREAKTISQLSHPHICALYDVGENYLVMELLEGETLAERVAKGPLPLADVLKYGSQIAQALGRAHRAGIIHRDLKPGNVMLTKHGAKLLDFGLAKGASSPPSPASDLTQQKPLTAEGMVIGTYQYMAPEQLAAEEPDARTDIFALGCVLYEMATGRRAFDGKTRTSIVAAIISGEPRLLAEVQPMTPRAFEHVVTKCLAKDPEDRWQSAADIAEELHWIAEERPADSAARRSILPAIAVAAIVAILLSAATGLWFLRRNSRDGALRYVDLTAPEGAAFVFDTSTAVLSPNGQEVAMVAKGENAPPMLWVRTLSSGSAHPLKGTENAMFPFWSPDSKQIGFFADGKLRRIDTASSAVEVLADASSPRGGSWGTSDMIVFSPSPGTPIHGVPARGGEDRVVTKLDVPRGHGSHRFPVFLPDGKHFLFFVQGAIQGGNVLVASLDPNEPMRGVVTADAGVAFAPPDHIVFVRQGALRAQTFDTKSLTAVGDAVPIAERVQVSSSLNFANVSVSSNGLLTYVSGGSATLSKFAFFDIHGKELATIGTPGEQLDPRIAPDGHAVLSARPDNTGATDIWLHDLRRDVSTRLTFSPANEFAPQWSPDGRTIAFSSFDRRPGDIFIKRVDEAGPGEPLIVDFRRKVVSDWSRDGNYIIYHALTPGNEWDIEAYSMRDRKVIPLVHSVHPESLGHLSPDGRWLAYMSLESGKPEIYVIRFPVGNDRWQVSGGGGTMPMWSPDGHDIYFATSDDKMMAAAVHTDGATFSADAPRLLFTTRLKASVGVTRGQYDVARDGRLLMNVAAGVEARQPSITLVENWVKKLGDQ